MSVNALLNDDSSKGWSNLYVNSLTTYKDLTVKGDLKLQSASGGPKTYSHRCRVVGATQTFFINVTFLEIGGMVTCIIPAFSKRTIANGILSIIPDLPFPKKYTCSSEIQYPIMVQTNASIVTNGVLLIDSDNLITIFPGYASGSNSKNNFIGNNGSANDVGLNKDVSITYIGQ